MALSSIIKLTCDQCGKVAVEKSRINFGTSKLITLECGHVINESVMTSSGIAHILNGTELWKYQVDGVSFLERSNARALLADEQGLGKTVQVLALIKLHQAELTPCVVVAPSSVTPQWHTEIREKCGIHGFLTQVIKSGKELAAPGFDIYVITYDLLKNEKCFDLVKDNIKLVVIDECQRIKDHLSGRAKAVQKICKNVEHIIPLSGTPIKNHAGEYFTVLNLIAPRMFPHYATFIERECDSYHNGWGYKVGGLRNPEAFHDKTKDLIIRRTKDEVLPDLPQKTRKFFHCELDRRLNKAYAEALQELEDAYYNDDSAFAKQSCMLAIMTKMRQVTGIGKVQQCVDYVTEFIESNERKIVVFAHHHVTVHMLVEKYNAWAAENGQEPCLNLEAGSGDEKAEVVAKFKNGTARVMIASTLAAGEGLNLQFCSDAVMLERQWNPPNEVQAEDRFHRFGQQWPVSIIYMIATETIDEYFTQIVEGKRAVISSTMDNKEIQWDQNSLMTELANILVTTGKKAWSLK
jgi:SWI/SNF-related matrix-associated actin-dependent regulator 1 of chromatin subfamily A